MSAYVRVQYGGATMLRISPLEHAVEFIVAGRRYVEDGAVYEEVIEAKRAGLLSQLFHRRGQRNGIRVVELNQE